MKILQLSPTFVPSKYGGTKKLTYELSKTLVAKGHDVTVYTTDADIGKKRLTFNKGINIVDGIKVRYFRNMSNFLAYRFRFFMPFGISGMAKKELMNFDIVHLHCHRSVENIFIHHYAQKYGVPFVLDAHGSTPRSHGKKGFKTFLRWLFDKAFGDAILRDATKVVAESELGVNEYLEAGVKDKDKIVMITPLRDIAEFLNIPQKGLFKQKYNLQNKHVVLFLGRIHQIKGIDFLVESFNELLKVRNDVMLVIVGPDDGYKTTLEQLIDKLNIKDKVLFTGFQDGQNKLSALTDADVLVQTSVYEQGAWAPYEAVLCNTPIIVSSNSGAGEDVRKMDTGYLVEYGNKTELREMLQYVLNNTAEVALKTKKAKEYIIANLSLEKGIVKYENLYADCMKQNKLLRERKK